MRKLGHREREKEREIERRLRAAGVPIEAGKEESPELLIRQDIDAYEGTVFDAAEAGTGVVLPLKIVPTIPVFVFSGFDICLVRCPNIRFAPLEENHGGEWPHYSFYGRPDLKFDCSETINPFIAQAEGFRRGRVLRGLLFAFSYESMPDEIASGEVLRGSIKILDQFEHSHALDILLRAHREPARALKPNPGRRKLLECPDPKPSRATGRNGAI